MREKAIKILLIVGTVLISVSLIIFSFKKEEKQSHIHKEEDGAKLKVPHPKGSPQAANFIKNNKKKTELKDETATNQNKD